VYLLYIDESGTHKGSQFDHFVMGGVALRDEDVYPFSRSVAALQRRVLPKFPGLEIHATDIFSGRSTWAVVPPADRIRLLKAVFEHLQTWTAPSGGHPVYFGVAINRPSNVGKDILQLAHVELLKRFDTLLSRLHNAGDSHRSLVIADNSSYEKVVQKLVPEWKVSGTIIGKLHGLVEVPLFVDSAASRAVQMADCVAWAIFNYYERGNAEFMQSLNGRFDAEGGIQHGLAHLVRSYHRCPCVPCASKRTNTVSSSLSPWPLTQ